MPQPEFRPGLKYVCDDRIYGEVHQSLVEQGQRPIVLEIDGRDITFTIQRKEVVNG